jgi:hypothetical protein
MSWFDAADRGATHGSHFRVINDIWMTLIGTMTWNLGTDSPEVRRRGMQFVGRQVAGGYAESVGYQPPHYRGPLSARGTGHERDPRGSRHRWFQDLPASRTDKSHTHFQASARVDEHLQAGYVAGLVGGQVHHGMRNISGLNVRNRQCLQEWECEFRILPCRIR